MLSREPTSKNSQNDENIAEVALLKAKNAIGTLRGVNKEKLYTSPVFAELVHFFLSQLTNAQKPQVLHD